MVSRRRADNVCLNGPDFKRPQATNVTCNCTLETDMECDYGFIKTGVCTHGCGQDFACATRKWQSATCFAVIFAAYTPFKPEYLPFHKHEWDVSSFKFQVSSFKLQV